MTQTVHAFIVYFGTVWLVIGLLFVAALALGNVRRIARDEE
ncbi:hypothetical protein [Ferruginivarius sediminum]|nr:hypothetical protein [Ferruginivarius sediminum]